MPVEAGTVYALSDVNMRKVAALNGQAVCTVEKNAKLTTIGSHGSWVKVKYQGKQGYIYGLYLARGIGKPPVARRVNTDGVNLRQKPDGNIIRTLNNKESVLVISLATKDHWLKVKTKEGKKGYVYSKYLTVKTKKDLRLEQINAWRNAAVRYCKRHLKDKYSQEKRDEKGYADCSSLMRDAFHTVADGDIGGNTDAQVAVMKKYLYKIHSVYQVHSGDILYHLSGENENHCGIYAGDGVVINASQTVGCVKVSYYDKDSKYWEYACRAANYCYDEKYK